MIRAYKIEDKPKLMEIISANTPKYFAEDEYSQFGEYLEKQLENYFVLIIDQKIIGCAGINYYLPISTASLSWGMIHPDYHRKGYGTEMTQHRISVIKNNPSINCIRVRTSQVVFKHYEQNGFQTKEIVKDYWARGLDLYHMEMDLLK